MTPETQARMTLLCGRPIYRISDMTPVEIEATLNMGTDTLAELIAVRRDK